MSPENIVIATIGLSIGLLKKHVPDFALLGVGRGQEEQGLALLGDVEGHSLIDHEGDPPTVEVEPDRVHALGVNLSIVEESDDQSWLCGETVEGIGQVGVAPRAEGLVADAEVVEDAELFLEEGADPVPHHLLDEVGEHFGDVSESFWDREELLVHELLAGGEGGQNLVLEISKVHA